MARVTKKGRESTNKVEIEKEVLQLISQKYIKNAKKQLYAKKLENFEEMTEYQNTHNLL